MTVRWASALLPPRSEVTLEYRFRPDEKLEPLQFLLSGWVRHAVLQRAAAFSKMRSARFVRAVTGSLRRPLIVLASLFCSLPSALPRAAPTGDLQRHDAPDSDHLP